MTWNQTWTCTCDRCGFQGETNKGELISGWVFLDWRKAPFVTASSYVTSDTHRFVQHCGVTNDDGSQQIHICPACAEIILAAIKTEVALDTNKRQINVAALISERDSYKAVLDQLDSLLDAARKRVKPYHGPVSTVELEFERLAVLLNGLGMGDTEAKK